MEAWEVTLRILVEPKVSKDELWEIIARVERVVPALDERVSSVWVALNGIREVEILER